MAVKKVREVGACDAKFHMVRIESTRGMRIKLHMAATHD